LFRNPIDGSQRSYDYKGCRQGDCYDVWRDRFIQSGGSCAGAQTNVSRFEAPIARANAALVRRKNLIGLLKELNHLIDQTKLLLRQPIDDVGLTIVLKQLDDMEKARLEFVSIIGE
jgi:hypothetical protein